MLVFAGAAMMLASCGETSMKVNTLDTAVNEALMAGREDSLHVVISLEYPVATSQMRPGKRSAIRFR